MGVGSFDNNYGANSGTSIKDTTSSAIVKVTSRHIALGTRGQIVLSDFGQFKEPVIEADEEYLRIGCTSISYEAFRTIAAWWERTASSVRKMQ